MVDPEYEPHTGSDLVPHHAFDHWWISLHHFYDSVVRFVPTEMYIIKIHLMPPRTDGYLYFATVNLSAQTTWDPVDVLKQ